MAEWGQGFRPAYFRYACDGGMGSRLQASILEVRLRWWYGVKASGQHFQVRLHGGMRSGLQASSLQGGLHGERDQGFRPAIKRNACIAEWGQGFRQQSLGTSAWWYEVRASGQHTSGMPAMVVWVKGLRPAILRYAHMAEWGQGLGLFLR